MTPVCPSQASLRDKTSQKNTSLARSICHETKWLLDLYYSKLNDMFAQSDVLENLFVWLGHMH